MHYRGKVGFTYCVQLPFIIPLHTTLLCVYEINKVEEMAGFCVLHFHFGVITVVSQNFASFTVIKSTTLGIFLLSQRGSGCEMIYASLCRFFGQ